MNFGGGNIGGWAFCLAMRGPMLWALRLGSQITNNQGATFEKHTLGHFQEYRNKIDSRSSWMSKKAEQ